MKVLRSMFSAAAARVKSACCSGSTRMLMGDDLGMTVKLVELQQSIANEYTSFHSPKGTILRIQWQVHAPKYFQIGI